MFHDRWKLAAAYLAVLVLVALNFGDPAFRGWAVFFFTLIGLGSLVFSVAWFTQAKGIDDWVSRQGDAPIHYVLSDETVETISQAGSAKVTWDSFAELAVTDFDTLLKFPRRAGVLTLDTAQVPAGAIEFMKERFRAHGRKVEDARKRG
jgi:hypothetical protein